MLNQAQVQSHSPAAFPYVDLDEAGGTIGMEAWARSRNVHYTDVGTVTRRPGLRARHIPLNDSTLPLLAESPASYAVGGLYHFRVTHNVPGTGANLYLAKVDQYLVASQFGVAYDIPVAKGLGGSGHQAYFSEAYVNAENRRYLIVGSSNPQYGLSYWSGTVLTSGQSYDPADWGFLSKIPWVPLGYQFAVEHNQRLFVAGVGPVVLYSQAGDFRSLGGQIIMDPRWGRVTGFLPTYYGELIVGQERAVSRVQFTSGLPSGATTITTEAGLVGPNASAMIGNDIVYMNTKGQVTTVGTTDRFGSLETQVLSAPVFRRFDDLPRAAWSHAWIEDDPSESILWIGHCRRSGRKNDALTGWNYKVNKFEVAENDSMVGFACGAVMELPSERGPKLFMGTYGSTQGGSGLIVSFDQLHKEDIRLYSKAEADGSADQVYGDSARVFLSGANALGRGDASPPDAADFTLGGSYSPASTKTTLILRITASGTIGAGSISAEIYDLAEDERWTIDQDLGAAYTPDDPVALLSTGNYDSGLTVTIPEVDVVTGEELFVHVHNARKIVSVYHSDLPDSSQGIGISTLSGLTVGNFVPYVETLPVIAGHPRNLIRIEGFTVITRVKGNLADTVAIPPSLEPSDNPYRFMLDMYVKADRDATWRHLVCLDGNAAKKPHLDLSLTEDNGTYVKDRGDLQHYTSSDDTEANGTPMAKDSDINIEYVPFDHACHVFQLRFGQESMSSLAHALLASTALGIRQGDFELIGFHVHYKPVGEESPNEGTLSVKVA